MGHFHKDFFAFVGYYDKNQWFFLGIKLVYRLHEWA